ncbi:MAG: hypothetical protein RL411_1492 [Bacteroidota bacterium]|jgi:hypothetical protein
MKKSIVILFLICFKSVSAIAQIVEKSEDLKKVNYFVGVQLLGPAWFASLGAGCVIDNKLTLELGGGLVGYYGGFKYAFHNNSISSKMDLYTGLLFARSPASTKYLFDGEMENRLYLPLGFRKQKGNFFFSPEVAMNWYTNRTNPYKSDFVSYFGYQIGMIF